MSDEVDVTWEDQQRINKFGRLTARVHQIDADLLGVKQEYDNVEDAQGEIGLMDDDDVMYKVGGVFVKMSREDAEERVEKALEEAKEELERLETEREHIKGELAELKVVLYEKFGSNINLEE